MSGIMGHRGLLMSARQEIPITSLAFSQVNEIDYTDLLPAALTDMTETFASDTGQFTKYTEGTAGTTSIAGNKMTVTHSSGARNDIVVQNAQSLTVPQCWVEVQVNVTNTGGTSYDGGGVGLAKDANNFIWASLDRLNSIVRVQIKIGGTNTFLGSITQAWGTSFKLAMSMIGNSICVWADTGSGWVFKVGQDVTTQYNFQTTGNLTGWKPAFTLANGGGTSVWEFSNFKFGRFGAVGIRDMTLVTNEDGSPYFPSSDKVLFSATAVDPRGIGYAGVFELDLTARTIAQKSVIMVQRSGKTYGDLSPHIIYYANGNRRMVIGTWGNGFGGSIQTLHQLFTTGDILTGTNLVTMTGITLPGQSGANPGAYDAMAVYDAANARWLIAYTLVDNTNFSGNPFYAAACYTTDWSSFTLIAKDSTHNGYEGTKLIPVGGAYFIAAGGPAGSGNSSRVYDASMNYLGPLNAVFHGGADTQPHPMAFPYGDKMLMLTFDNTKYGSGAFTWGNAEIYEAARYS